MCVNVPFRCSGMLCSGSLRRRVHGAPSAWWVGPPGCLGATRIHDTAPNSCCALAASAATGISSQVPSAQQTAQENAALMADMPWLRDRRCPDEHLAYMRLLHHFGTHVAVAVSFGAKEVLRFQLSKMEQARPPRGPELRCAALRCAARRGAALRFARNAMRGTYAHTQLGGVGGPIVSGHLCVVLAFARWCEGMRPRSSSVRRSRCDRRAGRATSALECASCTCAL